MNTPGSICPAIKAAEIIGDKWVLLLLRELLFGTTCYNDFQRALPRISPTVLSKRLKQMEQHGLIVKKTSAGSRLWQHVDKRAFPSDPNDQSLVSAVCLLRHPTGAIDELACIP